MRIRVFIGLIIVALLTPSMFAYKIILEKKLPLASSNDNFLQFPMGFSVTEDGVILVADAKASNVKIYDNSGELKSVLGKKGYGPNEFAVIWFCGYFDSKFFICDAGQNKNFVYERKGKYDFVRTSAFSSRSTGFDFHLDDNTVLTSGDITKDGIAYSLLAFDIDTGNHTNHYLPVFKKFGLKSQDEYMQKVHSDSEIGLLDTLTYFDKYGDYAYLVCQVDLKAFKINLKTGNFTSFGEKTPNYVQPYVNRKIADAFGSRNLKVFRQYKKKMSFVRQIFTTSKHVLLFYEARNMNGQDLGIMVQFYTLDGTFIREIPMPGKMGFTLWMDKKGNRIYSIEEKLEGDDVNYSLAIYKLIESGAAVK